MKQLKLKANSSSKLSLPVNSVKLCLLAQVKPLMEPSLYSLKSPTSSAPERSRCLVAPTRKTWGLSLSWPPTPGPSCSTIKSAPVEVEGLNAGMSLQAKPATSPPLGCLSLILLSSHAMASSLVLGASSSTTRGVKAAPLVPDDCGILSSPRSPAASASAKCKKVLVFLFSHKLKYRAKVQESRAKSIGQIHFKCVFIMQYTAKK